MYTDNAAADVDGIEHGNNNNTIQLHDTRAAPRLQRMPAFNYRNRPSM